MRQNEVEELTSESAIKAEENFSTAIRRAPVRNNILKHLSIVPTEVQADKFEDKKLKSVAKRCAKLKVAVKERLAKHKADVKPFKGVKTIKALAELRTLKVSDLDRIGTLLNDARLTRMEQDYNKKMANRWRPVLKQVDIIRKALNTYVDDPYGNIRPKKTPKKVKVKSTVGSGTVTSDSEIIDYNPLTNGGKMIRHVPSMDPRNSATAVNIPKRTINKLPVGLQKRAMLFNETGRADLPKTQVSEFAMALLKAGVMYTTQELSAGKVRFLKSGTERGTEAVGVKARRGRAGSRGADLGTGMSEFLTDHASFQSSAVLTAVPVAALPKYVKQQLPKKGFNVISAEFSPYDEGVEALAGLRKSELAVAAGAPDVVEKALSRFQFQANAGADFIIAAAMDVKVLFKKKGDRANDKETVKGFQCAKHSGSFTYAEGKVRAFKLPTKDGSIIIYMPQKDTKQLTHEFRQQVRKYKFRKAGAKDTVVVPNVNLENHIDINGTANVEVSSKTAGLGSVLSNESFDLITKFEMDEVGARVRQVAAMNMTKSLARKFKIDRPFVAIIERGGREVFAAYVAKDSWIKG